MPDSDFTADLRDIRFVIFEQVALRNLLALPGYAQLDAEQLEMTLDECYKFCRSVLAPLNRAGDREGCHFEGGQVTMPKGYREAWRQYAENGWMALSLPESVGGMGLPHVVGTATSEIGIGACCAFTLGAGLNRAAASLLAAFGTEAMKQLYIPKLVSGEWQGTMCLTEPQAGSAVGDTKTLAVPDGDGYLLSGTKCFITSGDHDMTANHVHLVLARTPGAPRGIKGISLFLVPKHLPTADGGVGPSNDVTCGGIEHKLGIKGSPTCTLNFGEEGKCRGWLIGEINQGINHMFHMMNEARIGVGIQGLALGAAATQYATAYAAERLQGVDVEKMRDPDAPRVAINAHPDVRRNLLFCQSVVQASRALLYTVVYHFDLAEHAADPAERERHLGLVEFLTPVVKAYLSDMGFEVTARALQVMGGYGYIAEYPIEQHLRDVKIASIYEGTNGIQALDLLGRKVSAKGGALFMAVSQLLGGFAAAHRRHLALGDLFGQLAAEVERWTATTMKLGAIGMAGDRRYPVLQATPYLEMTGHLTAAWMLLTGAIIAHDKLQGIYLDQGATDPSTRRRLAQDHAEARFYANKLEAARYFVHHVLPRNRALAAEIESGDRSALDFQP